MSKLYKFLVLVVLILEVNLFSLVELPILKEYNTYHTKWITLFISIFSLYFIFLTVIKPNTSIKRNYNQPVVLFLISLIFITMFSLIIYDQSFTGLIKSNYFYIIIVLYYFLSYFCLKSKENFEYLIKVLITIGTIYSILLIIQYYFLRLGIGQFLIFDNNNLVYLGNNYRMARPADFIAFSTIFLYSRILYNNFTKKVFLYIALLINLFYLIMVSQTRMYIIAVLVTLVISLFFISKRNKAVKNFIYTILAISLLLVSSQTIKGFISSFTEGNRVVSTEIRIEEIQFYSQQIFNNILFGRGFLDNTLLQYTNLIKGPYGAFSATDVGLLGFISIFGFLGILFIFIIVKKIVITFNNFKRGSAQTYEQILLILLSIYLPLVSLTLVFTDSQRIIYLPITLAILEVIYQKSIVIVQRGELTT